MSLPKDKGRKVIKVEAVLLHVPYLSLSYVNKASLKRRNDESVTSLCRDQHTLYRCGLDDRGYLKFQTNITFPLVYKSKRVMVILLAAASFKQLLCSAPYASANT